MGILSDLGSQFTSDLMLQEIFSLLSVTLNFNTSPYRAQTNGMADRFRGELRTMLRFMTVKDPPTGASSLHPSPSLCVSGIVQR